MLSTAQNPFGLKGDTRMITIAGSSESAGCTPRRQTDPRLYDRSELQVRTTRLLMLLLLPVALSALSACGGGYSNEEAEDPPPPPQVGSAPAPFSLQDLTEVQNDGDQYLGNLLGLLTALDADGDLSDGLVLDAQAQAAVASAAAGGKSI